MQGPDLRVAEEIALEIENDGYVYKKFSLPVIRNLAKKDAKGTYESERATVAWRHVVNIYVTGFGPGDRLGYPSTHPSIEPSSISGATRNRAAQEIRDYYRESVYLEAREPGRI